MHYSALALAVATFTVGGQSFLIPPTMNKEAFSDDEFALMNLAGGSSPNNRVLKADCKGCFADGKDGVLIYDIAISNLGHPKFLINGADLTPMDLNPGHADFMELTIPPAFLTVPLVPPESSIADLALMDLKPSEVKVMYNSYTELSQLGDGETVKLILEATSVDGRPVPRSNTQKIEVHIVREESGKMVVMDAKVLPLDEVKYFDLPLPTDIFGGSSGDKCEGFLCELFEKISGLGHKVGNKINKWGKKIRPCGKKAGFSEEPSEHKKEKEEKHKHGDDHKKDSHEDDDIVNILPIFSIPTADRESSSSPSSWRRPPYARPHHRPQDGEEEHRPHARPWSHHHHHHHHHGKPNHMSHAHAAGGAVYKVFVQVLVPIAIGVIAGMVVSLIGMVVGHFAVLAWQRVTGAVGKKGDNSEEGADEESGKGLLSHGEYRDEEGDGEAAPQYEEVGGVVEEKQ